MTPLKLLKQVVGELQTHSGKYAIAGGLAASFYRAQPRLTNDVDIALAVGSYEKSKQVAIDVIEAVGYDAALDWIYTGEKRATKPAPMIIGRHHKNDLDGTVDFLLPAFPWVKNAVKRAQDHIIDFGFAKLPTITPEDLLLAKALALEIEPNRFQDMDDIKSIFAARNALDLTYLVNECDRLKLAFPFVLHAYLPSALRRVSQARFSSKHA